MRRALLVGLFAIGALHFVGVAFAQPGDWEVKRDPFDRVVIAKYQALLGKDAHDVVLAKLVDLYKRYRTLALLVTEYETKLAAAPDDANLLVIVARLREAAGDRDGALELYTRAHTQSPDDVATALKIGSVQRAAGRLREARELLEDTLGRISTRPDKQRAVVKSLADLAYFMRDRIGAATYAIRYSELDPQNPRAHVDRGDALVSIGFRERAAEAYAAAEKLYATDASRRLDVIAARGKALERARPADAEADYRRAIALAPRGHYLREELFVRIIDLHRRAETMHVLLKRTLDDWPEATRGVFEWTQIATMFEAVGHRGDSTAALEKAVARSADARLHLQLADRHGTSNHKRAFEILGALGNRMQRDLGVMISIAERYARWGHLANALVTYERIMKLDPAVEERLIGLVEAPLRANDEIAARTALRSVVLRLHKPASFGRLGDVLLEWGLYREADEAFTIALKRDANNPQYWRGRAAARDSLGEIGNAVSDAERVIVLSADAKDRRQARKDLVRIVMHANAHNGARAPYVESWREAFANDPPDIDAGHLLLEFFQRSPCETWHSVRSTCGREVVGVVEQLSKIATVEFDDVIALATSHAAARRHLEAVELLDLLERIAPDRKTDIDRYRDRVTKWRSGTPYRYARHRRVGYTHHWIDDPDDGVQYRHNRRGRIDSREAIQVPVRAGIRLGAGAGMRGDSDQVVTLGALAAARIARNVYLTSRLDYTERRSLDIPISAAGMSLGVGTAIRTTPRTALVLGLSQRLERRFGDMIQEAGLSRVGFSTDLSLDLVGRRVPLGVGVRLEQSLSDDARSTAVMFELTLELLR